MYVNIYCIYTVYTNYSIWSDTYKGDLRYPSQALTLISGKSAMADDLQNDWISNNDLECVNKTKAVVPSLFVPVFLLNIIKNLLPHHNKIYLY